MTRREGVSRETLDRLDILVDLARRWSSRINLLGPAELRLVWERHIWDSAQLISYIAPGARSAIDLGSGAGFPGLVLSIMSSLPFVLVEADRRKAAFLREAIRATEAPATVSAQRAERCRLSADLVTARALAPLDRLLELATPLLSPDGQCLFLKGATAPQEVKAAEQAWTMTVRQTASTTSNGYVLAITAIRRRKA